MTPYHKLRWISSSLALQNACFAWNSASSSIGPVRALFSVQAAKSNDEEDVRSGESLCEQPAPCTQLKCAAEHPTAVLRQILERIPPYPSPSTVRNVRRWMEESGLCANIPASLVAIGARVVPTARVRDADAILAYVTGILQPTNSHPVDRHWARASLPELLLLLARLRIPSHPKLEAVLILILRRGKLPTPDMHTGRAASPPISPQQLPLPVSGPIPPTVFRITQAMAALPVLSHEAWQQLAERHIMGRPGQLLDHLSPDQMALVAASFARAGYHPVHLLRSIADRLLPAVPQLQPSSLARALHAFAILNHYDPYLIVALCKEVQCRSTGSGGGVAASSSVASTGVSLGNPGGGSAAVGVGPISGGDGSSFLSLAGAAIFGNRRSVRPDRAHRAPQFLLEDLARIAAAAVQLGAGEATIRGTSIDGGGGGGGGGGLHSAGYIAGWGEQLLEMVAEDAEEAAGARLKLVLEMLRAESRVPAHVRALEDKRQLGLFEIGRDMAGISNGCTSGGGGGSGSAEVECGREDTSFDADISKRSFDDADGAPKLTGALPDNSIGCSSAVASGGRGRSSGNFITDQLEPVLTLLEALVAGAVGAPGSATARAAHVIAARHLVPELSSLSLYMAPHQLVTILAALLPGPGAAALAMTLRQLSQPYPGPPPPQRLSCQSVDASVSSCKELVRGGSGNRNTSLSEDVASPGDQLTAVAKALCQQTDPQVFRSAQHLLEAWHVLAAARAGGSSGADDPRVIRHLMAPVFACVVRHVAMLGSPPEAARFIVSCALLSVYDKAALDALAAPLVAALGGGGSPGGSGSRQMSQEGVVAGNRGGASSARMVRCRTTALAPLALAQLAWAVGQLGYSNEYLLGVIQNQALALSTPSRNQEARSLEYYSPWQQNTEGTHLGSIPAADAAAAGLAAPPQLGPLELADIMWGLAVNHFRTNQGADIRELYLRAASQGVVRIDDPRWLRLTQVHLLLLLGWAGSLGETAAGQLRSGWFNALGYSWEHQAVAHREHLAGPMGLPADPDPATTVFRQGVATGLRDLIRAENKCELAGGGSWRLQPGFAWGMPQPSADIHVTVPLLLRFRPAARVLGVDGASGGGREWAVALDLVRCADEALLVTKMTVRDESEVVSQEAGVTAATIADTQLSLSPPGPPLPPTQQAEGGGEGHLLGPARWRQLVLRRLGLVVRIVRQEEWEAADNQERRAVLLRALRR